MEAVHTSDYEVIMWRCSAVTHVVLRWPSRVVREMCTMDLHTALQYMHTCYFILFSWTRCVHLCILNPLLSEGTVRFDRYAMVVILCCVFVDFSCWFWAIYCNFCNEKYQVHVCFECVCACMQHHASVYLHVFWAKKWNITSLVNWLFFNNVLWLIGRILELWLAAC